MLQMHDDLYDGLKEKSRKVHKFYSIDQTAEQVLGKALVDGMTIVGIDFRDGILFVPEVACRKCHERWYGYFATPAGGDGREAVGTMVIGTVVISTTSVKISSL